MDTTKANTLNSFELSYIDILYWLLKWKWMIIGLVVLCAAGGYYYSFSSYTLRYSATASMVVNSRPNYYIINNETLSQKATDVQLSQKLVDTYSIILKSNRVMEYVINDLQIDYTPAAVRSWIKLTPQKDTQVLFLTVTCDNPTLAVNVANSIMKVAPQAMMETVEIGYINVLDCATLPKSAIPFNPKRQILIATLIGMAIGIFITFLLGVAIPKAKSSEDIETKLVLQTLGEIPHVKRTDKENSLLICEPDAKMHFVEAYSMFSTILKFQMDNKNMKSVVITSAVEGEGKTTVAVNLALSLSGSGKKVMLIDGDLRRPSIHKKLNLNIENNKSLIDLLSGAADLDECLVKVNDCLHVIPGSWADQHSSNILASDNVRDIIKVMENYYQYIIIDSPPACALSDALILSNYADGVVMVVKQDCASMRAISEVVFNISRTGSVILGCVLNDIKRAPVGSGYKNKYYYYSEKYASHQGGVKTGRNKAFAAANRGDER